MAVPTSARRRSTCGQQAVQPQPKLIDAVPQRAQGAAAVLPGGQAGGKRVKRQASQRQHDGKAEARRIADSVDAERFMGATVMRRADGEPFIEVWLRAERGDVA